MDYEKSLFTNNLYVLSVGGYRKTLINTKQALILQKYKKNYQTVAVPVVLKVEDNQVIKILVCQMFKLAIKRNKTDRATTERSDDRYLRAEMLNVF